MRLTKAPATMLVRRAWLGLGVYALSAAGGAGMLLAGPACLAPPPPPRDTILVNGLERTFKVFDPGDLDTTPSAVVFVLHGGGGDAETVSDLHFESRWEELAYLNRFLLVFPEGRADPDGDGGHHWNDCRPGEDIQDENVLSNEDDVQFLLQLITWLADRFPIDSERLYFAGLSNGGGMALRLASESGNVCAAVAAVAAGMAGNSECPPPAEPVPMLFMHGTEDTFIPEAGGCIADECAIGEVIPLEDALAAWINVNGASTEFEYAPLPDAVARDNSTAEAYVYPGGAAGAEVIYYRIIGGGHTVPGSRPLPPSIALLLGPKNRDFKAADAIWQFFARHARPTGRANQLPLPADDGPIVLSRGTPGIDIGVLENDVDQDGDGLTVTAVTQPMHGEASIGDDRASVVYVPARFYAGQDSFTYTVIDRQGGGATANVLVSVAP